MATDQRRIPDGNIEELVLAAQKGNRDALERVVAAVQPDIYSLCVRFLWHPADAKDAAQEILIKIVTHLGSFHGRSSFRTWIYRVSVNTLLDIKRGRLERAGLTFASFAADLDHWPPVAALATPPEAEQTLLLEEVRVGCTLAMLLCLDRPHRLAYILGEILELQHGEAAVVLDISPAAFRQRLSRARRAIVGFMQAKCGLVNPANACRCRRRLPIAIANGRVVPDKTLHAGFGASARSFPEVLANIRQLEETQRAVALYRAQPEPRAPQSLAHFVRRLLDNEVDA